MRVRMIEHKAWQRGTVLNKGCEYDLPNFQAQTLIAEGFAVHLEVPEHKPLEAEIHDVADERETVPPEKPKRKK